MSEEYHVEFVCTGNTCRSPMAEGILKKRLADLGEDNIKVTSSGIMEMYGTPAAPLSVEVCESHDIDISRHKARAFDPDGKPSVDLYLALADEHFSHMLSMGVSKDRVFMLKTFPRRTNDLVGASIEDPIGGNRTQYERAFLEIDEAVTKSIGEIIRRARAKQRVKK